MRIAPRDYQVFLEPDFERQFTVMQILGEHTDVPTAKVYRLERDDRWFGNPFWIMERVAGRIPTDTPPYAGERLAARRHPDATGARVVERHRRDGRASTGSTSTRSHLTLDAASCSPTRSDGSSTTTSGSSPGRRTARRIHSRAQRWRACAPTGPRRPPRARRSCGATRA